MSATVVDDFYGKIAQLLKIVDSAKETSLHVWATDHLRRILVLVIANYFENRVTEVMNRFVETHSGNPMIKAFLQKAMERKYYQYFEWTQRKKPNADNFFSLFGQDFKEEACLDVNDCQGLKEGIAAFIEIGDTRNHLIHRKLEEVPLPKTGEEYYLLYKKALVFLEYVDSKLR